VTIGDNAFFHPREHRLTDTNKLTLPPELPALESIGEGAFRGREGSCNFSKSPKLVSIGRSAFSHYSSEFISFAGCTALERVGERAFADCSVDVIDLSHCATLSFIGNDAFQCTSDRIDLSNCTSLVEVPPCTFEGCSAGVIDLSHCAALGYIGDRAFYNCTTVHTIDLSGCTALERIGLDVFKGCAALASLDISNSALFEGFQKNSLCCPALETLRLPADAPMRKLLADAFGLTRTGPEHATLAKVTFVHTSALKEANPCWFEMVDFGLKRAMEAAAGRILKLEKRISRDRKHIREQEIAQSLPDSEAELEWLQGLVAKAAEASVFRVNATTLHPNLTTSLPRGFEFDLKLFTLCPNLLFTGVTVDGVDEAIELFGACVPVQEFLDDFPDAAISQHTDGS